MNPVAFRLLLNEGVAANAFDQSALDRIRNVFSGARVRVEVHVKIEVAGFVFFDALTGAVVLDSATP